VDAQPWVLAAGVLLIAGVVATKTSTRLGVPSLLLFIGLGMLAGSDGVGGIEFDDFDLARSFGVIALGFILFSGGLDTRFADIRPVLGQGVALASIGVALTASLVAALASWALDLSGEEAILLGAIIASTDAAAVFSILRTRGVAIDGRLGATLELESGSNDPAAVFLTVAAIEMLTSERTGIALIVGSFVLQMTLGAICGYLLARAATWVLSRLHLDFDGIYPVLTVGFVLMTLEGVTMVGGSGFLALYVAGVTMANRDYIHKRSLIRFHDGVAWLMQIAMFVLLGLLVFPARLPDVALDGLFVAAVLIFVARPLAVFVTLLPFRVPVRETTFISWVGLRGATPIILATFPVAAGVANAGWLFDIVFFVVLTSVLIQGTTIAIAARRLRLVDDTAPSARRVSFDSVITGDDGPRLSEVTIGPRSPAADRQILDLDLPNGVLVVLVRRGAVSFMPQGSTVLEVGDEVLIAVEPEHAASIDRQFSG
jgi:cell volume regulation protein A